MEPSRLARFRTLSALCLLCLAGTAVAGAHRQSGDSLSALGDAPAAAAVARNPYMAQPNAIKAGQKLFHRHCKECHGPAAEGDELGPSLRTALVERSSSGELFWLLTNGNLRRGMPSWSRLPDERRWQLVTYIKSLTDTLDETQ